MVADCCDWGETNLNILTHMLTRIGTRGVRRNGMVHGVTGQSNGHQSGCRNWITSLEMMVYVHLRPWVVRTVS